MLARLDLPEGTVGVCSTHLDHKAEQLREKQIRAVISSAQVAFGGQEDPRIIPHFICGDLNTFAAKASGIRAHRGARRVTRARWQLHPRVPRCRG